MLGHSAFAFNLSLMILHITSTIEIKIGWTVENRSPQSRRKLRGGFMIDFIVNIYRVMVAVAFAVAMVAVTLLATSGLYGFLMAISMFVVSIFGVGISAVLISINDHLAAAGGRAQPPRPKYVMIFLAAIFALALVVGLAVDYFRAPVSDASVDASAVPTTSPTLAPNAVPSDLDKNGCSPTLAAKMRLKCPTT